MTDVSKSKLGAAVVETRLGPIQVARLGEGPPVLVVHGSPGGYDQGAVLARFLVDAGFEAILPSRPGYHDTPLGDRKTPDDQARLLAALLDRLELDRVGVYCWSGGGPASYRLAATRPERVRALVAFDAVSRRWTPPPEPLSSRLMLSTRIGVWLAHALIAHAPKSMVKETLAAEGSLTKEELARRTAEVLADEDKARFVLDLDRTVSYREPHKAGLENDIAQFAAIGSLELHQVQAPCLVIHGTADADVPPEHGDHAAAALPRAELLTMDRGTHLCLYTHPQAVAAQQRAIAHLRA